MKPPAGRYILWMIKLLHGGRAPDKVGQYLQTAGMVVKRPGESIWSLTPEGYEFARANDKTPPGEVFKMPKKEAKPPPTGATAPTDVELKAAIKFLRQEDGQVGVKQTTLDWVASSVQRFIASRAKTKAEFQAKKKAKLAAHSIESSDAEKTA